LEPGTRQLVRGMRRFAPLGLSTRPRQVLRSYGECDGTGAGQDRLDLVGIGLFALSKHVGFDIPPWDWMVVASLGALVGMGELVSSYRDAPTRVIVTIPAVPTHLLERTSGRRALAVSNSIYPVTLSDPEVATSNTIHWSQVLIAGFGAMTLLRSSVFNVRTAGQDLVVGPAALLQTVLDAADRSLDRLRAQERAWT
jgi:hypothetical protein